MKQNYHKRLKVSSKTITIFIFINLIISCLINYRYILNFNGTFDLSGIVFVNAALVSNSLLLYGIIALIVYIFNFIFPAKRYLYLVLLPLTLLYHFFLFADTSLFKMWKMHINSLVINQVWAEITGDSNSLEFGAEMWIVVIVLVLIIIVFEVFLLNKIYNIYSKPEKKIFKSWKSITLTAMVCLLIIISEKITYGFADLLDNVKITRYSKLFPLYQPLTIKRLARKFGYEDSRKMKFSINKTESSLEYPDRINEQPENINKPNIIWIFFDAFRYDMFSKEVTPNIYKFSKRSVVFNNHYSGGNASRFGVFSIFYSIYGYYWHQFLSERVPPLFINELKENDYDFKILSSTKLSSPEFRKTCFINIYKHIEDDFEGDTPEKKDQQLADRFNTWLDERDKTKQFFSFLFFDAPHALSYPDKFDKFKPSVRTVNYITSSKKDSLRLINSYKNSIYFDDYLAGKIINKLEKDSLLDNTIIIFSADHGEEFYEHGYRGHCSAFTPEQSKVPFIMYMPGKVHEKIDYLTSHHDVVPTMLEYMGYKTNVDKYSQGRSLFSESPNPFIYCSGWDEGAIIYNDGTIILGTETYNNKFEIRNKDYKLIEKKEEFRKIRKNRSKDIFTVLKEFSRFNK